MARKRPQDAPRTSTRLMLSPTAYGHLRLTHAMWNELGLLVIDEVEAMYAREWRKAQRQARERGIDVAAWLKARQQPKAPQAPTTHAPESRPAVRYD